MPQELRSEPMFRRFDADHDGFLSLAEYRKSFPSRRGGVPANSDTSTKLSANTEAIAVATTSRPGTVPDEASPRIRSAL